MKNDFKNGQMGKIEKTKNMKKRKKIETKKKRKTEKKKTKGFL